MYSKPAAIWTTVIILMLCIGGIGIYHCHIYSDYNKALKSNISPYTREDIENSDAAYLLDPNFQITPENFSQVMEDYFSAPSRLDINYAYSPKLSEEMLISDKIKVHAEIGKVFAKYTEVIDGEVMPEESIELTEMTEYEFSNGIGSIFIHCCGGKSYIQCFDFAFCDSNIVINEEITKEIDPAIKKVLPYTMYCGD